MINLKYSLHLTKPRHQIVKRDNMTLKHITMLGPKGISHKKGFQNENRLCHKSTPA